MADIQIFFNNESTKAQLQSASGVLGKVLNNQKIRLLKITLDFINSNAGTFDQYCQYCISHDYIAGDFSTQLNNVINESQNNPIYDVDLLYARTYEFIREYELSQIDELHSNQREFIDFAETDPSNFSFNAQRVIQAIKIQLPIAILKNLIYSKRIDLLANSNQKIEEKISKWENKLNTWDQKIEKSEKNVEQLKTVLDKHAQAFNFVGLSEGFSELSKQITLEKRFAQGRMLIFGILLLIPSLGDIYYFLNHKVAPSEMTLYQLVALGIGSLTLTLLFLYFFRIALHKVNSCDTQLLQIKLRMSLCQFIQNYAEYSNEIRKTNPDALNKFEALIFSGIVGSDDKLPTTFDGLEQLTALTKSIRSK